MYKFVVGALGGLFACSGGHSAVSDGPPGVVVDTGMQDGGRLDGDGTIDAGTMGSACISPTVERCDVTMTTCLVSPTPELSLHNEIPAVHPPYSIKGGDDAWMFVDGHPTHYTPACGWVRLDSSTTIIEGSYPTVDTGSSNVWFAGGARWDGTQFIAFPFTANQPVWTASSDVGWYGCNRWDGTNWTSYTCAATALGGSADDDVWIGGDLGALWHWDGVNLAGPLDTPLSNASPTPPPIETILALAPDDAFFLTSFGWYHWDGSTFTEGVQPTYLPGVPRWDEISNGEQYWDGTTFEYPQPYPPEQDDGFDYSLNSLSTGWNLLDFNGLTAPDDLEQGQSGWEWYFRPSRWISTFDHNHMFTVYRTLGASAQSDQGMRLGHLDETGWQDSGILDFPHPTVSPEIPPPEIEQIHPTGANEAWVLAIQTGGAIDERYLLHYVDGVTTLMQQGETPTMGIYDFQSSASDDVWIAMGMGLWHWDGSNLSQALAMQPSYLWMPSPGQIWAVYFGEIYMFDGTTWTTMAGPPNVQPGATWGRSLTDVWSGVAHWDGTEWRFPANPGIDTSIVKIVSTGPTDAFFISSTGSVTHYDGASFAPVSNPPGGTFMGFDAATRDLWFYVTNKGTYRFHPN